MSDERAPETIAEAPMEGSEPVVEEAVGAPDQDGESEAAAEADKSGMDLARETLAGATSCGVLGSMAFLACFPLVLLVIGIAMIVVPGVLFHSWAQSPAVELLDDLTMAQETRLGSHGAYAPAAPCPAEVPQTGPVNFPGDCPSPWPELELGWDSVPCQLEVGLPEPGRFLAIARCPTGDGVETWTATEARGPQQDPGTE